MTLPVGFALAMDAQFRELSNFATPPRAGRITAIEMSGQVRVDCDDPDGGDVLAWPLDGFTYAVNDVVYLAFAVNNPESAIVLGSKSGEPSGGPYIRKDGTVALTGEWDIGEDRAIRAERLEARDGEGLRLEDDGGNEGLTILDGGNARAGGRFGAGGTTPSAVIQASGDISAAYAGVVASISDCMLALTNVVGSEAVNLMAFFQFSVNGGTYNRVGGIGYIAESASNRKASLVFITDNGSSRAEKMRLTGDGNVGIGTDAPQGKLHVHDGSAGKGLFTKTGVNATPQTIIPNGAGDVVRGVYGSVILTDGTNTAAPSAMSLRQGGTTTFDVTAGTSTWRTTLNADGSLTVARTAGTGTATISYDLHWM